jgi:hypothetical protein
MNAHPSYDLVALPILSIILRRDQLIEKIIDYRIIYYYHPQGSQLFEGPSASRVLGASYGG